MLRNVQSGSSASARSARHGWSKYSTYTLCLFLMVFLKILEERTLPAIVYPEIFVISDSKHNEVFESTEDFVKYVVVFFASVALRYAKVQHPRIFPKLVGVERASRQSEPYIRMYSSDQMTAEHTLDELARHVAERQTEFRGVDLVLLLTGRSMVSVSTGTARPGVAGLAFTGGMCTKRRVAESIDRRGFYEGIRHAAHEMGHSFGAGHDGQPPVSHIPGNNGAYHCSWDDGYEMSYVAKNLNQFTFSRCSQEQFRVFFSLVPQRCLDRTYTQKKPTPSKKLPGDRLSRRRFCMHLTSNRGAKECTGQGKKQICKLECCPGLDMYDRRVARSIHWALDGTSCGKHRECYNGVCRKKTTFTNIWSLE
ncbi:unnamed protein product [Ixodes pacificus]